MPPRKAPMRLPLTENVGSNKPTSKSQSAKPSSSSKVTSQSKIDTLLAAANNVVGKENQDNVRKRSRDDNHEGEEELDDHANKEAPSAVSGMQICTAPRSDHEEESGESDDDGSFIIKWTPNQIRSKIRAFTNAQEMKIGEFQDAIGVSARSYGLFMRSNGVHGQYSDTYAGAHRFFAKKEKEVYKIPRANSKKVKLATESKTGKSTKEITDDLDVSGIHLTGEETQSVPVYDTCDDVRTKLSAHLRKPGVTMASLGRIVIETYKKGGGETDLKPVQSKQFTDFLSKSGPRSGCTSKVFFWRLEMEKIHGKKGLNISRDASHTYITAHMDDLINVTSYGQTEIISHGRKRTFI
ncbi:uncharacterized protein L201_000007 [Kwoniella dendrophila CBS 6074]|uniref:DUF7726 domain-containing protein n=1 Tax=Kwoniella dendrophila CBS 6074 TaxID=1295534 RepID=A0AAX4JI71_9TREE